MSYLLETKKILKERAFKEASQLVEGKIKEIRSGTPNLPFEKTKLAEVEINKFFYEGRTVDRVMIVLRSNGCQHYKTNGGCSMCAHLNGAPLTDKITHQNYVEQWNSVIDGSFVESAEKSFNLNDYPVVCVYNLGTAIIAIRKVASESSPFVIFVTMVSLIGG